jgi:molecular chaperone DnaK
MSQKIIGIDLGTINSCVAVIEGKRPVVIPNSEGGRTTPSVVAFDAGGNRIVGATAKRQAIQNPERTVQSIKRLMGSNHRVRMGDREFSPEQISACILQKLKMQAQQYLGEKVYRAIVTVPAYFDDAQRLATRHAAEIAGLDVLRVMNEPTASALAYGYNRFGQRCRLVIFDFGGGTFDVTILEMDEGVLQVRATNGDNRLGGDDFDQRIANWLARLIKSQYGLDVSNDRLAQQRIKEAAENAKIELTTLPSAQIRMPFLGMVDGEPVHLDTELFRPEFEKFTDDLRRLLPLPVTLNTAIR